ncbi:transposable element Tcb1 transposase [Trichonephila clavipes]|nr:transposable element Tcb1 transposase [Trichonephila clavipes]
MWICKRWIQEGTTDRNGQSPPHQCTTSREDRQILCMPVTDRSAIPRIIGHPIGSITHHLVSARTIRRRLCLSEKRSLLGLPLTLNHKRLRRQ